MRWRLGVLGASLLAPVFALAACGDGQPATGPKPTNISIAPPSAATAPTSTATPNRSVTPKGPATTPSIAQSEQVTMAVEAVAAAEAVVSDSAAVEVSKGGDGRLEWEVTLRAGENGRELRISGADGSVLTNESDQLDQAQLGAEPAVTVRRAIAIAEKQVSDGAVTDAELTRENGTRIWELSVDAGGGTEWEVVIDASSGQVIRKERD